MKPEIIKVTLSESAKEKMSWGKALIQQRFLSLKQLAVYMGLSTKTLYLWAEEGRIPAYKFGRVWRFDREQIDIFVKDNCGN